MSDDAFWNGKTFDDFLFRPQKGAVRSRRGVELASRLARGLTLELPIVSANMNSVTGARMAKAMALEGGIGVVHRGSSIERQRARVAEVKRTRSAVIQEPLRLPLGTTIREARRFAARHDITGILIETASDSRVLAGLLSQRDMPWTDDAEDRYVEEFMTPFDRLVVERPGITPQEAERILFDQRIERLPLVDEQRRIHGLITRKDLLFLRERPYASRDEEGRLLVGAAIGAHGDFLERAAALLEAGADCLFIDIAHGHSVVMERAIAALRKRFGNVPLVCGNVATREGARFLADCGADGIKVGVGPGSGCRTRMETAPGVPQLQAIREAWLAVRESVPIMADGGVRHDKDIFLALVCGASSVMLGSVLSGTDEAPGRVIEDPATHEKRKIYRGMTSPGAVFEALYDSDSESEDAEELEGALATAAEGQEVQVPYKGSVTDVLERVRDHLRSAISYAGKSSLGAAREEILPDPSRYLVALSEAARRESYER
jgi:IMP dehydrogenase